MMFARFETDGSLDTTFGTGGMTRVYLASVTPTDLAQQTDGKLVAVGAVLRRGLGLGEAESRASRQTVHSIRRSTAMAGPL